jgi:hypothetical protein
LEVNSQMNMPNFLIGCGARAITVSTLTLAVASSALAQSGERIDQLEREVQALQQRLLKLEAAAGASSPKPVSSGLGWKSIANWRQLKNGLEPNNVRALLGEPNRINGGTWSVWFYPGNGSVNFYEDKVAAWREPVQK